MNFIQSFGIGRIKIFIGGKAGGEGTNAAGFLSGKAFDSVVPGFHLVKFGECALERLSVPRAIGALLVKSADARIVNRLRRQQIVLGTRQFL